MGFILQLHSFFYITMFSLAIAFSASAQASDHNDINTLEIKAGVINFPPFFIINSDQTVSGVYHDIVKKTLLRAKMKYRLDTYPTKRLYHNLKSGETELFLGIKGSPEYDKHVLYSTMAISQIQMRIYAVGNTPMPNNKEDINNHRIITLRGYSYGGLISYFTDPKNNIDVTSTSNHRSSFLMLKEQRADYVINYKHPSNAALKNLDIPGLKYSSFYNAKIYFIVSKALPNAEQILQRLEQAYLELVALGELKYVENND